MTRNEVNGVLLVDKPGDWTSFDAVNFVRRKFNLTKTGHCGTLDPMATGLLVLLLGKATKLQDSLTSTSKIYEGTVTFGSETDTEDSTGNVISTGDASLATLEKVKNGLKSFMGPIKQIPPMVSAIKKDGKTLYSLARKGITIEREPRDITIYSFELLRFAPPSADFRVHCSKGTYVRTLCADLGRLLGCGGHMSALRRVQCGNLSIKQAHTMEEIKSWDLTALQNAVLDTETAAHS